MWQPRCNTEASPWHLVHLGLSLDGNVESLLRISIMQSYPPDSAQSLVTLLTTKSPESCWNLPEMLQSQACSQHRHRYNLNLTSSCSLTIGYNSPSDCRHWWVDITEFHPPKKTDKGGKPFLLIVQFLTVLVFLESDILCPVHKAVYIPQTCTISRCDCLHQVSLETSTTVKTTEASELAVPGSWPFLPSVPVCV